MKKFALILLVAVLCVPIFAFAACADPSDDPYDLSTKEIGYEIPVYPDCEFSYVVKWTERDPETREDIEKSCTVKITEFKATLTQKKSIETNDVVEDRFYRHYVTFQAKGKTDPSFAGQNFGFDFYCGGSRYVIEAKADDDGNIVWLEEHDIWQYSAEPIFAAVTKR